MYSFVLAVHVFLAIFLVTLILLQHGKGADVGAIMGSGGANSLFGAAGASNLLVKMTTLVAVMFMATSIMLVRMSTLAPGSIANSPDPLQNSVMKDLGDTPPVSGEPAAAAVTVVAGTPAAPAASPVADSQPVPPAAVPVAPQQTSAPVVSTPASSSGK